MEGMGINRMDDLLLNKVLGGILGSWLLVLVLSYLVGPLVYHPHHLEKQAYVIDIPEEGGAAEEKAPVSFATLINNADPAKGERQMAKCKSCHTWEKGGPNGTGPNLYNVLDRGRGAKADFGTYSSAMKAKGGSWTLEDLYHFLLSPKDFIPGTGMTFAGFGAKVENAADVVAFLNTNEESPLPLPQPDAAPEASGEASGDAAAAPEGATDEAPSDNMEVPAPAHP